MSRLLVDESEVRELLSQSDDPNVPLALEKICIREFDARISTVPRPSADGGTISVSTYNVSENLATNRNIHPRASLSDRFLVVRFQNWR